MTRRLAGALLLSLLLGPVLGPGEARAAEYSMATVARYVVDPAAGEIAVSVEVVFTNTTPNPSGGVSGFDRIDIGIHDGASDVLAADAKGPLAVEVEMRDGIRVASIKTRSRVRYKASASLTLSYRLVDGAASDLHVRPQVVEFAAWGFGTGSQVTVELPEGYTVVTDGERLASSTDGTLVRLSSGPIDDPSVWLSLISATRASEYTTHAQSVRLASGTVDLQVRAWVDDAAWGRRTLALLVRALPLLEEAIGLPYARVGPLVLTEVVDGGRATAEPASSGAEIQVAFDEPQFTLLHQAAHVWIGEHLTAERWIREGLASHFAARAAAGLGVELPYAPAQRAVELAQDARPLAVWGADATSPAQDAFAYASSWAFIDRIATAVGEGHLVRAIGRVAAGLSAYDPSSLDPTVSRGLPVTPVDTRRLLDQLAAVSGVDLATAFRDVALRPDAARELIQRAGARRAYDKLLEAAGDWGAPDPIRAEMADWRFDDARPRIEAARSWLIERDRLVDGIASAGLTTPGRLRERFMTDGGGPEAVAELDAERAVLDLFEAVQAQATGSLGPLDAIGLLGGDDPRILLTDAAFSFSAGDLQAAIDTLRAAELRLARATADGLVRVATAVVLLAGMLVLVRLSVRRFRGSPYTAAR